MKAADQDAYQHDHHGEYHRGEMEIAEQASTFDAFMGLTKWGSLAIAALLVFLILTFATGAGVFTAFLVTAVFAALGVFVLREKKSQNTRPGAGANARPH